MRKKKKLIKIANEIAELEKKLALGKDVESCEAKMMKLAESLSIDEMMIIDEYIMEKRLLHK